MAAEELKTETNTPVDSTPPEEDGSGKAMGFFDHLEELRNRLFWSIIALLIGISVSFFFTSDVIRYMMSTYGQKLVVLTPTDSVVVYLKVSLMIGAILAMPMFVYQIFGFVVPGLTKQERRWIFTVLPGTFALFIVGLIITWLLLVPLYINFLSTFQGDIFLANWTADSYITFVTTIVFWHGVCFETPAVFFFLARMGFVTAGSMVKYWRHALVAAALAAAFITPTVDPFTMIFITILLYGLYLLSVGLVFIALRLNRGRMELPH